ncbi:MAG: hypothetical protein LBJ59_00815 [Zoogloeaceae bacterium]|jgi:hypothetical protein|nr:hypothetical protein [Zoogloeaceae bacterium]
MKTWFKYSLGLSASLIFLSGTTTAMASEPIPIGNRDAFEKQYINCIESGLKDKCFVSIFSGHLTPNIKNAEEGLNNLNEIYLKNQMAGSPVYKVHAIDKTMRAGVFDSRTYLIERFDGSFIGCYIIFRNIQEKWYVYAFRMQESDEFIRKLLDSTALFSLDADQQWQ